MILSVLSNCSGQSRNFSKNFNTIMVNIRSHFCSRTDFFGQNAALITKLTEEIISGTDASRKIVRCSTYGMYLDLAAVMKTKRNVM